MIVILQHNQESARVAAGSNISILIAYRIIFDHRHSLRSSFGAVH